MRYRIFYIYLYPPLFPHAVYMVLYDGVLIPAFMGLGYRPLCSPGADFKKGLGPVSDSNLRLLSQINGIFYLSPWAQP